MIDNKIFIAVGGVLVFMPATPVLALAGIGVATVFSLVCSVINDEE